MRINKPVYQAEEPSEVAPTAGIPEIVHPPQINPPADNTPSAPEEQGTGTDYFATMPDNWREQIAGEDTGKLNTLQRYSDFGSFVDGGFEARNKVRAGELSSGLPENPTDQQMNDWREANDVPATHDAYDVQLESGFVMGEEDEAILGEMYPVFHGQNLSKVTVNKIVNGFMVARQREIEQIGLRDAEERTNAIRDLKGLWGGDFIGNQNRIQGVLARMPEAARDAISSARANGGAGPLLFNMPEILQFFESEERDRNPAGTVVPNTHNPVAAINDRIKEIRDIQRGPDADQYWNSQEMQDEYDGLLEAQEKMKAQGGA